MPFTFEAATMHLPSGPLDTFLHSLGTLGGSLLCFVGICSLAGGAGYLARMFDLVFIDGQHSRWSWMNFALACSVVPTAFLSLFMSWGLITYPLVLLFAFLFARFELPFVTLVIPFVLIAWQTAALRW